MRPQRFRMSLKRFWRSFVMTRAFGVAMVVFLVGTGLGLGCLFLLQTAEKVILRKELTSECLFRGTVLENSLNSSIVQLASFYSAFVKGKISMDQSNFSDFNQLVDLDSVPVFGVGLSVEITGSQIDQWESRYSQKVKAIDGQFNDLPVERNRSSYLPITFIHPYERSKFMIGVDTLSSPGRGEAATRALNTGQPTISDIIPLPESHGDGFVLFYPVFNYTFDGGFTKRAILSFAFEVGKVIDSDLKDMLPSKIKLVVHEGEHDSLQPDKVIWQHMRNGVKYIETLLFDVKISVVDRTWDLDCIPSADFVKTYVSWIPYAAFAAIQIIFAALALMVYRWIAMLHRTRKKVAEQAIRLQESMEGYELLVKYSKTVVCLIPDPMILLDSDGYIVGVNQHACKAVRYSSDELKFSKLHISSLISETIRLLDSGISGTSDKHGLVETGRREVTITRKDGTFFRADASISAIIGPFRNQFTSNIEIVDENSESRSHRKVAQVIIFHDITERVQHLNMIKEKEEQLRSQSEERQQMLLWLCHELRNPLHIINSFFQSAQPNDHASPREQAIEIQSAIVASEYIETVLDDILNYMGVGIERTVSDKSENIERNLAAVFMKAKERTEALARVKAIEIRLVCDLPDGISLSPTYSGMEFKSLIRKIFEFLILVMQEGSKIDLKITGTLPRDRTSGGFMYDGLLTCKVAMSAEVLTTLDLREMKIFSVGQSSRGKTFGSPGLSFSIVKKLSNKLRGGVSISAINSSGSVLNEPFKTQLEVIVDIPVSKILQSSESGLGSGVLNIDLKKKPTVLVAEDNPIVQAMTKKMVTKCGFPVVTANDGQQAVDLVRQLYNRKENDRLGIILMDLIMPNVSGYEAAESIRHKLNIQVSELPIIAVTANTLEEEKQKCLQSGNFDEFITKPVSIATLRTVLDTWSTKLSIGNV